MAIAVRFLYTSKHRLIYLFKRLPNHIYPDPITAHFIAMVGNSEWVGVVSFLVLGSY